MVRSMAQLVLEKAGFPTLAVADGVEALELFSSDAEKYGAVILDVSMPRLNGDAALKQMRAQRPDLPALLTSGYEADDLLPGLEGPGLVFLKKPYAPQTLVRELRALLGQPRSPQKGFLGAAGNLEGPESVP